MDLITVIIPVYNVEKYLKECLESIINQTYKNLEIILIDDGSTDASGEICDEYSKRDNRIRVVHKANGGLSSARNLGLDIANGEYVTFIDSDDYIDLEFMKTLHHLCIKNSADIVECEFIRFENSVVNTFNLKSVSTIDIYTIEDRRRHVYMKHSIACNKMYKHYIFEELRFPIGKINEDEYVTYKALYYCKGKSVYLSLPLYFYRCNPNSITGKKFSSKRFDAFDAFEERKRFYSERNECDLFWETVELYQRVLKKYYYLTKCNIENPQKYLQMIKQKMQSNMTEYFKLPTKSYLDKLKNKIISSFPDFYCVFIKCKENEEKITDERKMKK